MSWKWRDRACTNEVLLGLTVSVLSALDNALVQQIVNGDQSSVKIYMQSSVGKKHKKFPLVNVQLFNKKVNIHAVILARRSKEFSLYLFSGKRLVDFKIKSDSWRRETSWLEIQFPSFLEQHRTTCFGTSCKKILSLFKELYLCFLGLILLLKSRILASEHLAISVLFCSFKLQLVLPLRNTIHGQRAYVTNASKIHYEAEEHL